MSTDKLQNGNTSLLSVRTVPPECALWSPWPRPTRTELVTWLVWQTVGDEEQAEDGELALGDTFANEELIADEDPNMYAAPLPCVCVCVCV